MLDARWRYFDVYMLIVTGVLMAFGVVAVWSASGATQLTMGNSGVKQAVFGAVGVAILLVIANTDYRFIGALAWPAYIVGILGIASVKVLGTNIGGAQRWIDFGPITVQPSEFGKITTIVALAWFVASRGEEMRSLGNFLLSLGIVALPAGLVFLEPDLGSSMVYGAAWLAMMLVARTRILYLVGMAAAAAPLGWFAWYYVLQDYQKERLYAFRDPEKYVDSLSYNLIQSRIAVGSSGAFGHGLRGGTQSTNDLLAVKESDFIFSHVSSMFGFVGMVALFVIYVVLLWRFIRVVEVSKDSFGQCVAVAMFAVIFFQAFVNIGMNIGLLPVTGITLPFVSQGLSSVWAFLMGQGILQSILMRHRKLAFQPG
jgi:rod shape determining protein RodA